MRPSRTLCLVLLAFAFLPATAHATNTVTTFTVSGGPVVGGSVQYANGEITVADRAPGGMAVYISPDINNLVPVGVECPPNHTVTDRTCALFDGESSITVKLTGGCVSQAGTATLKAFNPYSPDPGQTSSLTVNPLQMTLAISPTLLHGGTGETASGSVGAGVTLRSGITVYFSSNPARGADRSHHRRAVEHHHLRLRRPRQPHLGHRRPQPSDHLHLQQHEPADAGHQSRHHPHRFRLRQPRAGGLP
jgi:hypothetical protein